MRLVNTENVHAGMVLGEAVHGAAGQILLQRGVKLTGDYITLLAEKGFPAIYIDDPDTSDIPVPDPIAPATRARVLGNLQKAFSTVSDRIDLFRQSSLQLALRELRSDRFATAVQSIASDAGFYEMFQDVDSLIEQLMDREVLVGLNSIKTHDRYTFQHSLDVTVMGIVLAKRAGWDKARQRMFGIGCILHDIGKIFIDLAILNKPGQLTADEFEIIKAHPVVGHELTRAIAPRLGYLVPQVAYQHHEREDGTGYPRGLRGDNTLGSNKRGGIHEFGSLAAVADIYDALTSHRCYRSGWATDRAVQFMMSMAGTHLNQDAVSIFASAVASYPVCSRIRVLSGRYRGFGGIVSAISRRELDRPKVRLLHNPQGERVDPVEIDLAVDRDIRIEGIAYDDPAKEMCLAA